MSLENVATKYGNSEGRPNVEILYKTVSALLGISDTFSFLKNEGGLSNGDSVAHLNSFYPHRLGDNDRRSGYGSKVLREAEVEARSNGAKAIYLLSSNDIADDFYKKNGYSEVHRYIFFKKL